MVDDRGIGATALDCRECGADVRQRQQPGLQGVPQPRTLQVLLRIEPGRHGRRITDGDALHGWLRQVPRASYRGSAARRHYRKRIAQKVAGRTWRNRTGALEVLHLDVVGTDEYIGRRSVSDLPRQDVRAGEVEPQRSAAGGRVGLLDL